MQLNIESGEPIEESFFFEPIPNKILEQKECKQILTKWGLVQSLKIGSFRFNQHFQQYDLDRFVTDLFNNPNVRYIINNLKYQKQAVSTVEYDKLRCYELTMEIFEEFEKENIVKNGYIHKIMPDYFEGIQICDKIRECLLIEQSQTFCVLNENQRKQLLIKIFQLLVIGGSFNQYEDVIGPYLEWTKKIYKSLVSVRKRSQTDQIFIESLVYEIKMIEKGSVYKKGTHPQSVLYLIINPSIRTIHIVSNSWNKQW